MELNREITNIKPSVIRYMNTIKTKCSDVINLGVGEPEYLTPDHVIAAGIKALEEKRTKYAPNMGIQVLREALVEKVRRDNGINVTINEIGITQGGAEAITSLMIAALNPGDEVLVMDPTYPGHLGAVALAHGVPVRVPVYEKNNWRVTAADLEKAITPKTKLLLYNSPSNPCGAVADRKSLEEIAKVAVKHDLLVISDEVYEKIVYDGREHISLATLPGMAERTASVFAFSKTYAMTGWRVGYFVVEHPVWKENTFKTHQNMLSCVNTMAQYAALEAVTGPQDWVHETVERYRIARDIVYEEINNVPGLSCVKPEGAFYSMINIKQLGDDDMAIATRMVEDFGIRMIPGSGFGPSGAGYIRMCYAVKPDTVKEGIARLAKGAKAMLNR